MSLLECDVICVMCSAMDRVQTNRVSEWYMFILLIQPQSNSLYPDGAIYLDRFSFFFLTMTSRNENKPKWNRSNEAIFKM